MGFSGLDLEHHQHGRAWALAVRLLLEQTLSSCAAKTFYRHRESPWQSPEDAARDGRPPKWVSAITAGTINHGWRPWLALPAGQRHRATGNSAKMISDHLLSRFSPPGRPALTAGTLTSGSGRPASASTAGWPAAAPRAPFQRWHSASYATAYSAYWPGVLRWRWGVMGLATPAAGSSAWLFPSLGSEFCHRWTMVRVQDSYQPCPPAPHLRRPNAFPARLTLLMDAITSIMYSPWPGGALWVAFQ